MLEPYAQCSTERSLNNHRVMNDSVRKPVTVKTGDNGSEIDEFPFLPVGVLPKQ
jgi:hypothetical protein